MEPLVSILIPAFNAEQWISASIRSALAQTWPRKEVIVVEDGSKDRTLEIARSFTGHPDFKLESQKNQGAAAARNRAYLLSRGDYIQWLDADDLLAPDKIERQVHALQRSGTPRTLASSAWGSFLYRPHRARFKPTSLWADHHPVDWLLLKFEHGIYMQTGAWLVSRELMEAAGSWDTRLLGDDDGEFFCRVMLASDNVLFVPEARMYYRQPGSGNLSHIGRSDRKMEAHFLSMCQHVRHVRAVEDSARVRSACIKYLQSWLVFFYPERPDIVREAEKLAEGLGGRIVAPRLGWKYAWLRWIFGWSGAKRAQAFYNAIKASGFRWWDKILYQVENRFSSRVKQPITG